MMRVALLFLLMIGSFRVMGQTTEQEEGVKYENTSYGYTINIPASFHSTEVRRGEENETKLVDDIGNTITISVYPRFPDEYGMSGHDYTNEKLEKSMKKSSPKFKILYSEKVIVSNEKAFLTESIGVMPNMKSIDWILYYKDKCYMINCTCQEAKFDKYKPIFLKAVSTLILKKVE